MKSIAQKLCPKSIIVVSGNLKITANYGISPMTVGQPPTLDILSESYGEESVFYPSQHIYIYGEAQLVAMRDFINKLLGVSSEPAHQEPTPTPAPTAD